MIKQSPGGEIEVSISDMPESDGKFSVSARQLVSGNMIAHIIITFGSATDQVDSQNETRLDYNTQNAQNRWRVSGSHSDRDVVRDVKVTSPTRLEHSQEVGEP